MNSHNQDAFHHRAKEPVVEAGQRQETSLLSIRTVSSAALFEGEHEIGIDHRGALYRLKITRQGKLILNK
ncbi:hemin uptake protein HemP [Pseudaminobacter soli (ex Li et al. 2025)]|uniref:Hemin uptake protein HemP n=1 Tax=Pseudaminobacter soli (ex Li et al. 2025) TaxID=1295366 RepID=A0A2P7SBV5_9HYPH|nr:hemin uptake protein HemP [Mesorhizobium soli]PSJ59950.1 hemin uptake protein HemP [Mesorhizobium soli]